jgi:uncharacterized protein (TIGR02271 family)
VVASQPQKKNLKNMESLMAITPSTRGTELIAFFRHRSDAVKAISELRDAGFTSDQIGLAIGDEHVQTTSRSGITDVTSGAAVSGAEDRSTWEKIKNFFKGEPETYGGDAENYREIFGHLSLAGDRVRYYESGIAAGGALLTVSASADRIERARTIIVNHHGDLSASGFEGRMNEFAVAGRPAANMSDMGERRIQLRGEMLRTVKERINKGEIRLRKEVITEHQTVNVPVTREEVVVEQVPASGSRPISGNIGDQGEVRIPVSEERVHVTKEPVVTSEVRVQKRAVQDTQQVSDDVRHEEVRVENEGDVNVTDKTKGKKKPAA